MASQPRVVPSCLENTPRKGLAALQERELGHTGSDGIIRLTCTCNVQAIDAFRGANAGGGERGRERYQGLCCQPIAVLHCYCPEVPHSPSPWQDLPLLALSLEPGPAQAHFLATVQAKGRARALGAGASLQLLLRALGGPGTRSGCPEGARAREN